jgi:hypothetical protein
VSELDFEVGGHFAGMRCASQDLSSVQEEVVM